MEILIFGGTTEGRQAAEGFDKNGWKVTLSVATEYGASLINNSNNIRILTGRQNRDKMIDLMRSRHFECVVDATHPYALEVTDNILAAAEALSLTVYRIVREVEAHGDWICAENAAHAAKLLENIKGNILLTTGSKDLNQFSGLKDRCFPRVLPDILSLKRCIDIGYNAKNIMCMQGPFSKEMNMAIIRQYGINVLVTKATGAAGGFWEKAEAARETDCVLIVIGQAREEKGCSVTELLLKLGRGDNG